MYRSPHGAVQPVLDDMQSQLAHEHGFNKPLLLVGDFNFDTAQPSKPGVQAYMEQLEDLNLKQLVTQPIRPSSGSVLEQVIVRTANVSTAQCPRIGKFGWETTP